MHKKSSSKLVKLSALLVIQMKSIQLFISYEIHANIILELLLSYIFLKQYAWIHYTGLKLVFSNCNMICMFAAFLNINRYNRQHFSLFIYYVLCYNALCKNHTYSRFLNLDTMQMTSSIYSLFIFSYSTELC